MMKRVVVTGVGVYSPIGTSYTAVDESLRNRRSGIRYMPEFEALDGINSHVAGVVEGADPMRIARKYRRSMGRVAQLMALATMDAVADAGLDPDRLSDPRIGLSMGSTMGSGSALEEIFLQFAKERTVRGHKSTSFLQVMSHTCAANMALMFSIRGRIYAPCTACTSSSQAIGFAYEAIQAGYQDMMLAGGAEEMHWTSVATFDVMQGTSYNFNDRPHLASRPFDADRTGLVVADGSACVILEELERAKSRGTKIYGEIEAFHTNSDGYHMSSPSTDGMRACMEGALAAGGLSPKDIDYINAHATATPLGDRAEAGAIRAIFEDKTPVSSTKSYTGHTFGACGAIETVFSLAMINKGYLAPTLNLESVDPECEGIDHITDVRDVAPRRIMSNNFAFGGVNTSLVIKKYEG
ncbi:MAG: beta-ketoacyl-[acyl-carrier-protein] synthase family protein [Nitrospinae bacterium]|nr:beta-ketoacyl-[acyl-carrier-protein] synthase family protein [Nitrospinota bacterium]